MVPGRRFGTAAALLTLWLSACVTVPEVELPLSGRMSLQVLASGEPARGWHAGFDLWGDARAGRLELSAPLGPRIASARWTPGEVLLDDGHGRRAYPSLQALAHDVFGQPLPLQALPDWLRGRPWPEAAHASTAQGFTQLGWQIDTSQSSAGLVVAWRQAGDAAAHTPAVTLRVRLADPPAGSAAATIAR